MGVAVVSESDRVGLERKLDNGVVANSGAVASLDDFDLILSGDDVTNRKPDPEIYLVAAERLGVPPESCIVVEDSARGVLAGKQAGMRVVAVPNQYTRLTQDFSTADAV